MKSNIAWQESICPVLPKIFGCVDFSEYTELLQGIDRELRESGLEKAMIARSLESLEKETGKELSGHRLLFLAKQRSIALHCTLARRLLQKSFRQFHVELAQSYVLQSFVGIFDMVEVHVPSKSQLERYEKFFTAQEIDKALRDHVNHLLDDAQSETGFGAVKLEEIYADSTCVQANIHHPVDWVLLRDAGRSILTTIQTIRRHDLRHRIPNPKSLKKELNRLSIRMSHSGRQKHGKKKRKKVLRSMKHLVNIILQHGLRYCALLRKRRYESNWSEGWIDHILNRLESHCNKVPRVIWQAHERIIGGRQVSNKEKLLSLYEDEVHVLVRGKAGAEVEFGNGLYLAEQQQGLVVDWEFFKGQPPADSTLVKDAIERLKTHYKEHAVNAYCADRGFDSRSNAAFLKEEGIFNAICPRRPVDRERNASNHRYTSMQNRRGQTEARIGIIRNMFIGSVVRSKGYENRRLTVLWSILTHNLWAMARLKRRKQQLLEAA